MHAFLLTGGTAPERLRAIQELVDTCGIPSYDQVQLTAGDNPTIGVADVRKFISQLQLGGSGNNGTAAIISDAGLLTTEAQQALLKTIEEPPPHVRLYLGVASETLVLPTIVSRCQLMPVVSSDIQHSAEELAHCTTLIHSIEAAGPGERIHIIQTIGKTRDDAKRWIDCAILACRSLAIEQSETAPHAGESSRMAYRIHALMNAKQLSANNVNPFQLLEHIFLDEDDLDKR